MRSVRRYFQQWFLAMIRSLRRRVFRQVSEVGLDTVVVEFEFKVLEAELHSGRLRLASVVSLNIRLVYASLVNLLCQSHF